MSVSDLDIAGHIVQSGEHKTISIEVGHLPSNTPIHINAEVYRSNQPGPTVLLIAGVHGDEINGIEIIRNCIDNGFLSNIKIGTVIAIPIFNIFGFINFSRDVPDGKDINRRFPGSQNGSLAGRIAHTLTHKVLPKVDYVLDFHTGGESRYNYPQIRFTEDDQTSKELAQVFNTYYTIAKKTIDNSLRKTTYMMEIPTLVFEGGESIRLDGYSINQGIIGIKRVLQHLKMIEFRESSPGNKSIFIKKTSWLRSPVAGLFIWNKKSGNKVTKGEPIGAVNNPFGHKSERIIAHKSGYIIGHNNASVVNEGDALFNIGYDEV